MVKKYAIVIDDSLRVIERIYLSHWVFRVHRTRALATLVSGHVYVPNGI